MLNAHFIIVHLIIIYLFKIVDKFKNYVFDWRVFNNFNDN